MLRAVMNDFGHSVDATLFLAHTTRTGVSEARGVHPHLRLISSPALRHVAHSQPAWLEN